MRYGYTPEKISELIANGILYNYGQVLCLACYQEAQENASPELYCDFITHAHLSKKHPKGFGMKHPVDHYRKIYPGVRVMSEAMFKSIKGEKDPSEEYREVTLNKIKKEVALAGGIGSYSTDQLLLLHKKMLLVADMYEKEGKYDKMLRALKYAEGVISNTSPAKSSIKGELSIREATDEDNDVLDKLDDLIEYIANDVKERKVSKTVNDGWTDAGS